MYHSLTNLGSTWAKLTDKRIGLLGFGTDATAVMFNEISITTSIEESCSTYTVLKDISEKTNVVSATIAPIHSYKLKSWILQFLPPFILNSFIKIPEKDPALLLVDLNTIISSFSQEHLNDNEFQSACDNCKQLCAFIYCTSIDKVPDLIYRADPDDVEIQNDKAKRQSERILPVTKETESSDAVGNMDAIQQLANSLQNQTDLIEELKVGRKEARAKKKVKFDNFNGP